jgi:hypothetical protein
MVAVQVPDSKHDAVPSKLLGELEGQLVQELIPADMSR